MASVISIGIRTEETDGNISISANHRKLTYIIVFDSAVLDTEEVFSASGSPYIGMEYPYNDSLHAYDININSEKNRTVWTLTVDFSADALVVEEGFGYDFKALPVIKEKIVRGAYWYNNPAKEETVERLDTPDYPIKMSTGNPPNEPLTDEETHIQFRWWQIESKAMTELIESGDIYLFQGTINQEEIKICGRSFPAFSVELKSVDPELYYYRPPNSTRSELRYKTTYVLEKPLETANKKVLDQDFQALLNVIDDTATMDSSSPDSESSGSKEVLRNIRLADLPENENEISLNGADDEEVPDPVKLDGTGHILEYGGTPIYIEYQTKPSRDWSKYLNMAAKRKKYK